MLWWESAQVGDRVVSIPTGMAGEIVSIQRGWLDGRWDLTVSLDQQQDAPAGASTTLSAPPDHFIPEEDVPVHDSEALEEWLDS